MKLLMITALASILSGQSFAAPIAPLLVAGAVLATGGVLTGLGAANGALQGKVVKDNLPEEHPAREKIIQAGAAKGAVSGLTSPLYLIPFLGPIARDHAQFRMTEKMLETKDLKIDDAKLSRAATLAGTTSQVTHLVAAPLPPITGAVNGAVTAKVMETDINSAAKTGAIGGLFLGTGTGELDAIARSLKPATQ